MEQGEGIRLERDGPIATITLDRPNKLNAMTRTMAIALVSLIDKIDTDDAVRAIILTGEGRAFCAGADLSPGQSSLSSEQKGEGESFDWANHNHRDFGGFITLRLFECLKPVIVAFNGPAAGVGVTMTLAADYRIASDSAKFVLPFTRRGIVPESASSWFLPRLVGIATALDWTIRGATVSARDALASGLVSALHEPDALLPAARAIAEEIARETAPVSVALTRRMLWGGLAAGHPEDMHRVESRGIFLRSRSADMREGVASFLEKRAPNFPDQVSSVLDDMSDWLDG